MNRFLSRLCRVVATLAVGGMAFAVQAEEVQTAAGAESGREAGRVLEGRTLDEAALAVWRGGADTHYSTLSATGTVSDVAASDVVTGQNLITAGALAGASGLPMVVQNSGNGVLIQNAVIVNVELH